MPIREIQFPPKVMRRARKIRVLLMDVDGTMTPGVVCLQSFPDGSVAEMKVFNAHDGAGIKLASIMGIRTGLITGRYWFPHPATPINVIIATAHWIFRDRFRFSGTPILPILSNSAAPAAVFLLSPADCPGTAMLCTLKYLTTKSILTNA